MRNLNNAVFLQLDNITQAKCIFERGGKAYTYLTTLPVKTGDKAIVMSPQSNKLEIVEVIGTVDGCPTDIDEVGFEYKLLVDVVNVQRYLDTKAAQAECTASITKQIAAKREADKKAKLAELRKEFAPTELATVDTLNNAISENLSDEQRDELHHVDDEPVVQAYLVRL